MLIELLAIGGAGALGYYLATHKIEAKPRRNPAGPRNVYHVVYGQDHWKVRDVGRNGQWTNVNIATTSEARAIMAYERQHQLPSTGEVAVAEEMGRPGEGFVNVYLRNDATARTQLVDSAEVGGDADLARQIADMLVNEKAPRLATNQRLYVMHENGIYALDEDPTRRMTLSWRYYWETAPLIASR